MSDKTGQTEIRIADRDGQNRRQLTKAGIVTTGGFYARWSPDGKQIVFECRDQHNTEICTIQADGSRDPNFVTHGPSNKLLPSWSRDGMSVYFTSDRSGRYQIYKQAIAGGEARQITFHAAI